MKKTREQLSERVKVLEHALENLIASHADYVDCHQRKTYPDLAWSQDIEDHARKILAQK